MEDNHPDPEVQERAKRRIFSLSYKTNILRITDDLPRGEIAGFLRKEALYWAQRVLSVLALDAPAPAPGRYTAPASGRVRVAR